MVMDVWRPRGISRRWPFRAFEEGERMLQSDWPFRLVWWRAPRDDMAWAPSIDMFEKEDAFIIRAELPGVKLEDVDISMTGDTLTVKGERKPPADVKEEEYECCEVCYGNFSRSITLPVTVEADKIQATMENGILEMRLPKVPEAKPTKITVKAKKA